MNRFRICLIPLLFCLVIFTTSSARAAELAASPTASLIVKVMAGLSQNQAAAVIARNGGVETSSVPALWLHVVEVPTSELPAVLLNYQSDQQVESVEENQTRKVEAITPPDPLYGDQWYLPKIGWDSVYGAWLPFNQATVAVLDTGVDASHPDLSGNIVAGTSIIDGSGGTTDTNGHGTSLAGIVAAVSNDLGVAGVGFSGVRIMPVTVLGADGYGKDADIIAGIIYAVDHGANVILMGFSNAGFSQNLQDAIDYAWSKDVVLVAAAGNGASSVPTYPAGDRGVMGVSATDSADALAPFSNFGKDVFISAPGVDIITTGLDYASYPALSGTSASAAIVAGVAAFLRAYDQTLTNGAVVGRIAATADPAGTSTDETGNGRVNIASALADSGFNPIEPSGAPGGGPYVGPYAAATYNITNVAVGSQGGTLTYGTGGSVTYAITTTGVGSGTRNLTLSALPSGVTGVFNPASVSRTAPNSTLTITTTGAASAVTAATFTVNVGSGNGSGSGNGTLTIGKATLTIAADNLSKIYGADNPSLTYTPSGFVNGDTAFVLSGSPALSTTAVTGSPVGSYTITASLGSLSAANYSFSLLNGTLTVTKATPTITWATPADIAYGTALSAVQLNATASVQGSFVYSPVSGTILNAGDGQTLGVTFTPTDTTDYDGTSKSVTINVSKAMASVTPDAASKTYGSADPALTGTLTGFLPADKVVASYTRAAGETVAGGPYAISATLSPATVLDNYNITYGAASFTINRKDASVTPDAASKTYGSADPALTGTLTGFLTADKVVASYTRAAGETVAGGPYAISATLGPANVLDNYNITYGAASFTINKANLTVTTPDQTKTVGAPVILPTASISGLKFSDAITMNTTTAATASSPVGLYPITTLLSDSGNILGNYNVINPGGTLLVLPANIVSEATGPAGAMVTFADGYGKITASPASGSMFPIGTTSVICTAMDAAGSTVTGNFTITVVDSTPPVITVPADITAIADPTGFATVTFTTSATDIVDGPVPVSTSPASGAAFPLGTTTVVCTATDKAGNTAVKSFKVNVPYKFGGYLDPVSLSSGRAFKQGSTIPVKFQLSDAAGNYCSLPSAPKLYVWDAGQGNMVDASVVEELPDVPPDTGFSYDTTGQQYHYNLGTKAFISGHTYQLWTTLSDGTTIVGTCRIYLK